MNRLKLFAGKQAATVNNAMKMAVDWCRQRRHIGQHWHRLYTLEQGKTAYSRRARYCQTAV